MIPPSDSGEGGYYDNQVKKGPLEGEKSPLEGEKGPQEAKKGLRGRKQPFSGCRTGKRLFPG